MIGPSASSCSFGLGSRAKYRYSSVIAVSRSSSDWMARHSARASSARVPLSAVSSPSSSSSSSVLSPIDDSGFLHLVRDHGGHLAHRGQPLGPDQLALALLDRGSHGVELARQIGDLARAALVDALAVVAARDLAGRVAQPAQRAQVDRRPDGGQHADQHRDRAPQDGQEAHLARAVLQAAGRVLHVGALAGLQRLRLAVDPPLQPLQLAQRRVGGRVARLARRRPRHRRAQALERRRQQQLLVHRPGLGDHGADLVDLLGGAPDVARHAPAGCRTARPGSSRSDPGTGRAAHAAGAALSRPAGPSARRSARRRGRTAAPAASRPGPDSPAPGGDNRPG